MDRTAIHALTMPKWGMAMEEGTITAWHCSVGARIVPGDEIVDAESTKAAAGIESRAEGVLRRIVAHPGDIVPVGGLIGVIAHPDVPEEAIEQFVAGFGPGELSVESDTGPAPERIVVGQRRMNVLRAGAGQATIMFIHGFGGSLSSWQFNQGALAARGYDTIAFDLPGHGFSDPDVGNGDLTSLTHATRELIDALAPTALNLVGHSLGGAIAMSLAIADPDRFKSVSLIASAGLGPEINHEFIAGFLAAKRRKDLQPVIAKLFVDSRSVTRDMLEELIRMKRIDGIETALQSIDKACFANGCQVDWGLREKLLSLSIPTQTIWGAMDQIIPVSHAAGMPNATIIENAGHMVHLERQEIVNRLLCQFLDAARP